MITFSFAEFEYKTQRIIGDIGNADGPTVVFVGGMHGNEPTGVIAIQQAIGELQKNEKQLRGRVLGLVGNSEALKRNQRFLAKDLNRVWNQDFLERWQESKGTQSQPSRSQECREQFELFEHIEPLLKDPQFRRRKNSPPRLYFADLHTTSARSVPFIGINDQLDNRQYALKFPVPTVLGIEEYLAGPLLSMLNDQGHVAMAFEAGQHSDPMSVEIHKAFIFCALDQAGVIPAELAIDSHEKLARAGQSMKGIFEVVYKRSVTEQEQFQMKPGYENFMPIKKGERLATDRSGAVFANRAGKIFMPLYQKHGDDGYFIVRQVPSWALTLSKFLRKVNFETLLTWLPGVSRSEHQRDALVVNKRIARFLAVELFHLLGYRRKRDDGDQMIVSRREIKKME